MRLSRHAKNRARGLKITLPDVERVVSMPTLVDEDETGKPRYMGTARGIVIRVVVALDDPEVIVTLYPRRKR